MLNARLRPHTVPGTATERVTLVPAYAALCADSGLRARTRARLPTAKPPGSHDRKRLANPHL